MNPSIFSRVPPLLDAELFWVLVEPVSASLDCFFVTDGRLDAGGFSDDLFLDGFSDDPFGEFSVGPFDGFSDDPFDGFSVAPFDRILVDGTELTPDGSIGEVPGDSVSVLSFGLSDFFDSSESSGMFRSFHAIVSLILKFI